MVAGYVLPGISGVLASRVVAALRAIGVAKSLASVISMIEDNGGVAVAILITLQQLIPGLLNKS
ncbi:MAG: hypothetical protein NHB14_08740 [Desulfosporosinus sp.]|nr:hypothetical protein [Desulfosporosinus sp.]